MDKLDRLVLAASEKDVRALRRAVANIEDDVSCAPLLVHLLPEKWHDSHEEIVVKLGIMGYHGAVDAISQVATIPFAHLVRRKSLHEFQRKCAYALARIGTVGARAALEDLAAGEDPQLREYAQEGLVMWPLPYSRR